MNTRLIKLAALLIAVIALPVHAQSTSSSSSSSSSSSAPLGPVLTRVITPPQKPLPTGPIPGTETPNRMQVGNGGNQQPRPVNPCPSCR